MLRCLTSLNFPPFLRTAVSSTVQLLVIVCTKSRYDYYLKLFENTANVKLTFLFEIWNKQRVVDTFFVHSSKYNN